VRRVLCASAGYLGRHGRPKRPGDIARHETISFTNGTHEPEWSFLVNGKRESVAPKARLVVNSADVAIAAAIEGRGLTRLMSYQAAPEIRAGRLKVVLREFEPEPFPVHVVYAAGRRAPAKVRAFVDLAVTRLRASVLS
jgi:DNA-binding transcriptional LysR family regulator